MYNRETNKYRGILCNTENVYQTPLSYNATQTINPFINSIISANHEKVEEFPYTLYCFSSVESIYLSIMYTG